MKVFIWEQIENATSSYHPEGGVVVIAATVERAKELATARGANFMDTELPDLVVETTCEVERAFIFPNAGCC